MNLRVSHVYLSPLNSVGGGACYPRCWGAAWAEARVLSRSRGAQGPGLSEDAASETPVKPRPPVSRALGKRCWGGGRWDKVTPGGENLLMQR